VQHSAESRGAENPDGRDDRAREPEHHAHDEDRVYGITTAETSHTQEITRRQKQYILTMLVRVVSIIVVVSVPGISWPLKIGLCVVATIIPYVAVVRANGGPTPEKDPTNLMLGQPGQGELGSAQRGLPASGADDFIVGEWVLRDPPAHDAHQRPSQEPAADEPTVRDVPAGEASDDASSSHASMTQGQDAGGKSGNVAAEPDPAVLRHGSGL
jgi:Protein of unknown function (DUF3099)